MWAMIPGSMGTRSYIVTGLENPMAFNSAPHGAGRRYSRTKVRQLFTMADLERAMDGIEFRRSHAVGRRNKLNQTNQTRRINTYRPASPFEPATASRL
jgi:RNA-splicing ligase RtcB